MQTQKIPLESKLGSPFLELQNIAVQKNPKIMENSCWRRARQHIQCPQQSYLHSRPSFSPPLALLPLVLESVVFPHPPDVGGGEGAERAPQQPRLGGVVLEEVRAQALDRLERAVRASLEVAAPVAAKGEKSRNNCVFSSKSLLLYLLCFRSWLFFLDLLLKDSGQTEQA